MMGRQPSGCPESHSFYVNLQILSASRVGLKAICVFKPLAAPFIPAASFPAGSLNTSRIPYTSLPLPTSSLIFFPLCLRQQDNSQRTLQGKAVQHTYSTLAQTISCWVDVVQGIAGDLSGSSWLVIKIYIKDGKLRW